MGDVRRRWFLPETPNVLELLRHQLAVTSGALQSFEAWAGGDAAEAEAVRDAEHRADAAKWEVLDALRAAFVTPLEPEDLFTLSRGIDRIVNYARDLVNESEAMGTQPDAGIAEMAAPLSEAVRHIDAALAALESDGQEATAAANEAIAAERRLEQSYYRGMAALLELGDRQERIARRELYRRCFRIGEAVVDVAERIVYAVVKQG
jgi:uncharacterized protein Yka (UPF0111/DUF47 family)